MIPRTAKKKLYRNLTTFFARCLRGTPTTWHALVLPTRATSKEANQILTLLRLRDVELHIVTGNQRVRSERPLSRRRLFPDDMALRKRRQIIKSRHFARR